ncbi:MAG TPA: PocR ligand-binding domain-containing protein, partial [Anaerovoracaceae bacterium]|nr:PocR ligand-binding domain-containing protein [Anaerovoracaceae bacterium]
MKESYVHMDFIRTLNEILSYYSYSTDIPLSVIDERGSELFCIGESTGFCRLFKECTGEQCPCMRTHLYASRQAEMFGEAYIFFCPAGLVLYVVPIVKLGQFKGSAIAGPILMDFDSDSMVNDILQKFDLDISLRSKLNISLRTIPVVEPAKVTNLSKLLFYSVSGLLHEDRNLLLERSEKQLQQSQINESIQAFKNLKDETFYPYEIEKELLRHVKNGDTLGARDILNDLIGHIFFSSGGNLDIMKAKALGLCTLLSRASLEGGADFTETVSLDNGFITEMKSINGLEDLSDWLSSMLSRFTGNVFSINSSKNAALIQKCIAYINEHYREDITLDQVAKAVHLNASYLSSLFKREIGIGFSSYLNKVRIDKSMLLIKNTNYSMVGVALSVGFENQSYFSKVFKCLTGMTPQEY